MVWPLTRELLDLIRAALGPDTFRRAWRAGEAISLADVAQTGF